MTSITIATHVGWEEYRSARDLNIYDGLCSPACEGSEPDVLAYLATLKKQIVRRWPAANLDRKSLRWEGSNGWWYRGREALDRVDAEIERLTGAVVRYEKTLAETGSQDDAHHDMYNP